MKEISDHNLLSACDLWYDAQAAPWPQERVLLYLTKANALPCYAIIDQYQSQPTQSISAENKENNGNFHQIKPLNIDNIDIPINYDKVSSSNEQSEETHEEKAPADGGQSTIHHQLQVASSSENTVPLGQRNGNWKNRPATTTHLKRETFSRKKFHQNGKGAYEEDSRGINVRAAHDKCLLKGPRRNLWNN